MFLSSEEQNVRKSGMRASEIAALASSVTPAQVYEAAVLGWERVREVDREINDLTGRIRELQEAEARVAALRASVLNEP